MLNGFENLDTYNRVLSAAFKDALPLASVPYQAFTMEVMSSSKTMDYAGLFEIPTVREWLGDRLIKQIKGHTYAITNKKWELTVELDREDIEDDEEAAISFLANKIRGLAEEANNHVGRLVYETLRAGKTGLGYDGQPFFSTTHVKKGGTQSNLDAGGSAPWYLVDTKKGVKTIVKQMRKAPELQLPTLQDESIKMRDKAIYGTRARYNVGYGLWQTAYRSEEDLTEANFQAALQAMMELEDENGRPLAIVPDLLIVPPSLRTKAKKLLAAEFIGNGESNVNKGEVNLIITPFVKE